MGFVLRVLGKAAGELLTSLTKLAGLGDRSSKVASGLRGALPEVHGQILKSAETADRQLIPFPTYEQQGASGLHPLFRLERDALGRLFGQFSGMYGPEGAKQLVRVIGGRGLSASTGNGEQYRRILVHAQLINNGEVLGGSRSEFLWGLHNKSTQPGQRPKDGMVVYAALSTGDALDNASLEVLNDFQQQFIGWLGDQVEIVDDNVVHRFDRKTGGWRLLRGQ